MTAKTAADGRPRVVIVTGGFDVAGRPPSPFSYRTLGVFVDLGHPEPLDQR